MATIEQATASPESSAASGIEFGDFTPTAAAGAERNSFVIVS